MRIAGDEGRRTESDGWRDLAARIKARLLAFPAYPWEKAALWEMIGWCHWRADLLDVE